MHALQLVDVIDLKWLLAGMGHRIHVERMLADRGYAEQCLAVAAQSPGAELREAAAKVCRQLGLEVGKAKPSG
jgi:hypothetical protein